MDERDSHCPYATPSEPTAKGTGLACTAGKEDPVELDSSLRARQRLCGVAQEGLVIQVDETLPRRRRFFLYRNKGRWGVWLGRHTCQRITQVSQAALAQDGNLGWTKRGKAALILSFFRKGEA